MSFSALRRLGTVLAMAGVSLSGCMRPSAPASVASVPMPAVPLKRVAPAVPTGPARSHALTTLAGRTLGPFVAKGAAGGLAAWIAPTPRGDGRELVVVPFAADGAPFRAPQALTRVPTEATSLVVEPAGGEHGGWFAMWSTLLDRGESLSVIGITPDGSARGAAVDVQRTGDHIKWADVVPGPHGALCLWAEETPAGDANLLTASIENDGRLRELPARVARGVDAWQTVPTGGGTVGLALVAVGPTGDGPPAGSLSWLRLDADGRPQASNVVVSARGTVSSDVDVVSTSDGWLLGWTDRTGEDPRAMLASVDASGHVSGPSQAMTAVGGSSLVGLASGPSGTALAWEEPHARARPTQELRLALVDVAKLTARSIATLDVMNGARPELVATPSGFSVLAPARACRRDSVDRCAGLVVPTFVRLDASLQVLQSEPFLLGDDGAPAALGWGIRCFPGDQCFALAATGSTPTLVYTVDLRSRVSPYVAPTALESATTVPRVTGVETIASGRDFDDVAAARVGDTTLVATMTAASDAAPGRRRPHGAQITLRSVDAQGRLLAPAKTQTSRALSIGGIALASGPDGAVMAWADRDGDGSSVHVARVDRNGHSTDEVRLDGPTRMASSVALARAGKGWIVAWADDHDGVGDVYAVKLDGVLHRVGHDQRVRHASGDASDVALAVSDGVCWIAWSDARESPRDGVADIFAATLRTEDAAPAGPEARVLSTALHSRSPSLVPVPGGGALVAWIEDAPAGVDATGAAMIARLDARGRVVGSPGALPFAPTERPTDVALRADVDGVRAVVAHAGRDGVTFDALRLGPEGKPVGDPQHLLDLDAPDSFDVALALTDDAMVYDDVGASPGDHRVRHASVTWK